MTDYKLVPVELIDPAAHLLSEAHKYWKHANAHHCGAVQWIEDHETGALLIFTRGEYREILMQNIVRLRRAEQPAPDVAELQAELERERKRRFDGNEQASREHREDMKALVEALVEALEALLAVRVIEADANYGLACAKAEQALAAWRQSNEEK